MLRRYAVALAALLAIAPSLQSQAQTADHLVDYAGSDDAPDYTPGIDAANIYSGDHGDYTYTPSGPGSPDTGFGGRVLVGHGRLTTNDLFGDRRDRWQTGSVSASRVVARGGWTGMLPDHPFDVLEYRLGVQVVSPEYIRVPAPDDRPFAGVVSLGLHTHFMRGPVEFSLGADLSATGSQTGIGSFQTAMHDLMGVVAASPSVLSNQIPNAVHPTAVVEVANTIPLGRGVLRPFAEARVGLETMVRAGVDLTFGPVGQGEFLVRDGISGQRYRVVTDAMPGFSYVLGGDFAYVDSSKLMPASRGYDVTNRSRARAGLHWQGDNKALFYGVTWLSKEFEAQPEGQFVGSMRIDLSF
ncbi:lipid A-modifier LpxR family protein [Sagittula salina]|uniref:DUF2219 family protein n=1 Tax=Sagittula salina TaxID=2820268 RepID=A0A940MTD5_9RHOB|nr:lipid A-modifier LpxR family protein [Sagittula salina]MBP0484313.1 DUF2219 family protein [Sagittula salina]